MADLKKRISELPLATDYSGLITLGVDSNNEGVQIPIGSILTDIKNNNGNQNIAFLSTKEAENLVDEIFN